MSETESLFHFVEASEVQTLVSFACEAFTVLLHHSLLYRGWLASSGEPEVHCMSDSTTHSSLLSLLQVCTVCFIKVCTAVYTRVVCLTVRLPRSQTCSMRSCCRMKRKSSRESGTPSPGGCCECVCVCVCACVCVHCVCVCVCAVSYTHLTLPTIDDV